MSMVHGSRDAHGGRETVNRVNMILVLLIMMLAVVRPSAMQQTVPNPAQAGLEVASITPNTSGTMAIGGIRFQPKGGELQATNVTLAELLKFAYQRHFFDEREVTGGPAWVTLTVSTCSSEWQVGMSSMPTEFLGRHWPC